jgi:O-antigen/teichoic acid export membrane protein
MLETLSVIVVAATAPAGYLWGALLTARRRQNSLGRYLAVGTALTLVLCMALWKRMSISATYAQFHGDFGVRPLAGSEMGSIILWLLLILGFASTWTLFSLYRLGQQASHG